MHACMQVCPADWQPGGKSIKMTPEGSLEYFQEAGKDSGSHEDFGTAIKPIQSRQEFEQLTKGDKPVVVDFYAPWCALNAVQHQSRHTHLCLCTQCCKAFL